MTDDRHQQKKSRTLILPKNLEFRKDCLFLKNGENLIFFTGPSLWRKREMTDVRRPTTAKKSLMHSFCLKILNFGKIACFWKTARIWFFSQVRPFDERGKWRTTDHGDVRRCQKNLVHSFCLKILNFGKIACFGKTARIWFFSQVRPCDERGKWWMTDDRQQQKKSHALILPKNLEFWKDCLYLKNGENLIFFTGPSLWRKREMTDDGDDRRRRKISYTHFD